MDNKYYTEVLKTSDGRYWLRIRRGEQTVYIDGDWSYDELFERVGLLQLNVDAYLETGLELLCG